MELVIAGYILTCITAISDKYANVMGSVVCTVYYRGIHNSVMLIKKLEVDVTQLQLEFMIIF